MFRGPSLITRERVVTHTSYKDEALVMWQEQKPSKTVKVSYEGIIGMESKNCPEEGKGEKSTYVRIETERTWKR